MEGLEYCLGISTKSERKALISSLSLIGMHCAGEGKDCSHFLRMVRSIQPHLVLMDLSFSGNVLETANVIDQEALSAVLLLDKQLSGHISALPVRELPYTLLKFPVSDQVLAAVVDVLYREFQRRRNLQNELLSLEDRLQKRIVIEQAKGLVMKRYSLDEQKAYRLLQKKSMELRMPLERLARSILKDQG